MNLNDIPIRGKLILVIMLTSTVVLFVTAAAFISYEVVSFRRSVVQNSQTIAQITAAEGGAAVSFEDENGCEEILAKLAAEPAISLAALYAKDGKLLARYPASAPLDLFPGTPISREYVLKGRVLDISVPVQQEGKWVGSLYLEWDLSAAYRRLRWDAVLVLAVLLGSLGIALIISSWLQRRISGPILELAGTARNVSSTRNYSARAKKFGNDELGQFTDSFNHMLEQIGEQDEALRKNQEQLRNALQRAETSAEEVRTLNSDLEARVARRTSELGHINQELEAFAHSVSHDLRAPLRHIDAFAQILQEEMEKDPVSARHYLDRIRLGVQNMGQLVDDLLKLSRVGRVELNFKTVSLNSILEEVLTELRVEMARRKIEWRIAPLPSANADAGLIKQVFANLVSNALKYTRPRNPAVIEIGVEKVGGQTAIFVRDNGVGFNMKYAHKLFGVFQRLHRTEDFEGTGVGLATVQRIIRLHGGKIWAEGELDKGATFHFIIAGIESPDAHEHAS